MTTVYQVILLKTAEVFRESEQGFDSAVLDRIAEATDKEPQQVLNDYINVNQEGNLT